eukprot:5896680-Pleurochrysis_carterae.AAC.1
MHVQNCTDCSLDLHGHAHRRLLKCTPTARAHTRAVRVDGSCCGCRRHGCTRDGIHVWTRTDDRRLMAAAAHDRGMRARIEKTYAQASPTPRAVAAEATRASSGRARRSRQNRLWAGAVVAHNAGLARPRPTLLCSYRRGRRELCARAVEWEVGRGRLSRDS